MLRDWFIKLDLFDKGDLPKRDLRDTRNFPNRFVLFFRKYMDPNVQLKNLSRLNLVMKELLEQYPELNKR